MKFIESGYNPTTGISYVVMQHLGKKFKGIAKLNPSEPEGSSYAGCYYAELRAKIKALKYERALAKQKSDMALDFVKSIEGYSKFNKEDPSAKVVYRQLNQRIKKVNDLADQINTTYKELDSAIRRRDIVTKAIDRKKSKVDKQ